MISGARVVVLAMLAPLAAAGLSAAEPVPTAPRSEIAPAVTGPLIVDSFRSVRTYPTVAAPVRIRIPALHVRSGLERLGRAPDGSVAVPRRADVAGWYARSPRPGQAGPAVILGHVDSASGPGVFFAVYRLSRGATVLVDTADGRTLRFVVTGVERVPKDRFPSGEVYAPTLRPTLRLLTCGGTFDARWGHYRDNVIVFADLS